MANTTIGRMNAMLTLNSTKFSTGMKGAQKSMSLLSTGAGKLAAGLAAAFGARAIVNGLKESLSLYARQEAAVNRLAASLKLAGDQSASSLDDFKRFASGIQAVTTMGDEAVLELASLGAALGRLSGQRLKDATVASIGLAKVAGIDAASAMKLLARAAQGGSVDFARYGVIVDKTKTAQEQFNQVLSVGTAGFALATAEVDTYAGKIAQLSNSYGDLKESIGAVIADPLTGFIDKTRETIDAVNELTGGVGVGNTALLGIAASAGKFFDNFTPLGVLLNTAGVSLGDKLSGAANSLVVDRFNLDQDAGFAQSLTDNAARIAESAKLEDEKRKTAGEEARAFSGRVRFLEALGFNTKGLARENGEMVGTLDKFQIGAPLIGQLQSLQRDFANPVTDLTRGLLRGVFGAPPQQAAVQGSQFAVQGPQFAGAFERGTAAEFSQRLAAMGRNANGPEAKTEKNTAKTEQNTRRLVDIMERFDLSQEQSLALVSF